MATDKFSTVVHTFSTVAPEDSTRFESGGAGDGVAFRSPATLPLVASAEGRGAAASGCSEPATFLPERATRTVPDLPELAISTRSANDASIRSASSGSHGSASSSGAPRAILARPDLPDLPPVERFSSTESGGREQFFIQCCVDEPLAFARKQRGQGWSSAGSKSRVFHGRSSRTPFLSGSRPMRARPSMAAEIRLASIFPITATIASCVLS
eukprot:6647367-Prymnesium_polylepis.1